MKKSFFSQPSSISLKKNTFNVSHISPLQKSTSTPHNSSHYNSPHSFHPIQIAPFSSTSLKNRKFSQFNKRLDTFNSTRLKSPLQQKHRTSATLQSFIKKRTLTRTTQAIKIKNQPLRQNNSTSQLSRSSTIRDKTIIFPNLEGIYQKKEGFLESKTLGERYKKTSELKKKMVFAKTFQELYAALYLKFFRKAPYATNEGDEGFCYDMLKRTSRSFAAVILELPEELKDAVCVFYLVLRGLDTVEDDPAFDINLKVPLLRDFHKKIYEKGFYVENCGENDNERKLMIGFPKLINVFLSLDSKYQNVICDITKRMGNGMADFLGKEVKTIEDYNLYCHYVAGLVGHGLTHLFITSGNENFNNLEKEELDRLSNSMGLFLQKTNIIRDYFEDINSSRMFWPEEIWNQYGSSIHDFKKKENIENAVDCLNHLVYDALKHAPDTLKYISLLKNQQIFNFCAIPQVMAISTLTEVYNNKNVFRQNVKIRKGLAANLMVNTRDTQDVMKAYNFFAKEIKHKMPKSCKTNNDMFVQVGLIESLTKEAGTMREGLSIKFTLISLGLLGTSYFVYKNQDFLKNKLYNSSHKLSFV